MLFRLHSATAAAVGAPPSLCELWGQPRGAVMHWQGCGHQHRPQACRACRELPHQLIRCMTGPLSFLSCCAVGQPRAKLCMGARGANMPAAGTEHCHQQRASAAWPVDSALLPTSWRNGQLACMQEAVSAALQRQADTSVPRQTRLRPTVSQCSADNARGQCHCYQYFSMLRLLLLQSLGLDCPAIKAWGHDDAVAGQEGCGEQNHHIGVTRALGDFHLPRLKWRNAEGARGPLICGEALPVM